jgi:hypothetical protein
MNLMAYVHNPNQWIDPMGLQTISNSPKSPDKCGELANIIDELINRNKHNFGDGQTGRHGLRYRFDEQANGINGPGTESWRNHHDEIKRQQNYLKNRLKDWDDSNCSNKGGGLPVGAWSWASAPAPTDTRNPNAIRPTATSNALGNAGKAVGTVGAGYLIYRGVRMIPSLLPVLWPTIPANLAAP